MGGEGLPGIPSAVSAAAQQVSERRAAELAVALKMGGQSHTRSVRSEFYRALVACLKWRAGWTKRPCDQQLEMASKGFCSLIPVKTKVKAWVPQIA